jgi:hypothetical protein
MTKVIDVSEQLFSSNSGNRADNQRITGPVLFGWCNMQVKELLIGFRVVASRRETLPVNARRAGKGPTYWQAPQGGILRISRVLSVVR